MAGVGAIAAGTLAWFFRALDRRVGAGSDVALGDWTVYGTVLGGWLGLAIVGFAAVVG